MTTTKLVLAIIIALLLIGVSGLLWLRNSAGGFSARQNPSPLESFLARRARALAVPRQVRELRNPVPYSDQVLEEGRAHWADHCAFCHANDGSGDTEVGRNLYPKAPDMRTSSTQSLPDGELYYVITNGVRLTGMPAWGTPADSDPDSWKLVYFIRHLPKMTRQEADEMQKMNPKTPMERMEEQREEEFLNGAPTTGSDDSQHTRNAGHRKEQEK